MIYENEPDKSKHKLPYINIKTIISLINFLEDKGIDTSELEGLKQITDKIVSTNEKLIFDQEVFDFYSNVIKRFENVVTTAYEFAKYSTKTYYRVRNNSLALKDVGDLLMHLIDNFSEITPYTKLKLVSAEDNYVLYIDHINYLVSDDANLFTNIVFISFFLMIIREFSKDPELGILINFSWDLSDENIKSFEALSKCKLEVGSETRIVVPKNIKHKTMQEYLYSKNLSGFNSQSFQAKPAPKNMSLNQFETLLIESILAGKNGKSEFSSKLGITERTLTNLLATKETTYAKILNSARKSIYKIVMSDNSVPPEEKHVLLGFTNKSSLYRFIKKENLPH